ncbi:hypothetical protein BDV36DRAFT_251150 [Aspergillus pseudocaelatus]|uniref:General substrate transporter n=1 Tax=Aspergillus pseudocaelatus TaxID=1825620 RepID=A0ABQ6WQV6_9EURO|nr:hypothetical protein BDV36DRAFT_251150 [Aspergillus pseudocaelatus]
MNSRFSECTFEDETNYARKTHLLTAYPCEVWPYQLRSRGLSLAWVSVAFGNMFKTFVNPITLDNIGWTYYLVFVAVLIAYEITVYFGYPETRGHTLEHMAVRFDKMLRVTLQGTIR